jgi:hypothetical protein
LVVLVGHEINTFLFVSFGHLVAKAQAETLQGTTQLEAAILPKLREKLDDHISIHLRSDLTGGDQVTELFTIFAVSFPVLEANFVGAFAPFLVGETRHCFRRQLRFMAATEIYGHDRGARSSLNNKAVYVFSLFLFALLMKEPSSAPQRDTMVLHMR